MLFGTLFKGPFSAPPFFFWSTDVQRLPTASDSSLRFKQVISAQPSWPLGPDALKQALSKSFPSTPDLWWAHFGSQTGPLAPSSGIRHCLIAEAALWVKNAFEIFFLSDLLRTPDKSISRTRYLAKDYNRILRNIFSAWLSLSPWIELSLASF